MKPIKSFLILFSLTFILAGCQTGSRDKACAPITRAAYDIGSGTTKLKVAKVNPCEGKILKVIAEEQIKVDYRQSLDASESFPPEMIEQGLASLRKLTELAKSKQVTHSRAVATAAFREATNADELVALIKSETGLEVEVISQEKEALLGYLAALNQVSFPAKQAIVWDIGGGSQQIVFSDGQADPEIYTNEVGSVVFKNAVISEVKKANIKTTESPNPLTAMQIQSATVLAKKLQKGFSPALKRALKRPDSKVLGIGGVHAYSIAEQTDVDGAYTVKDIEKVLKKRTGATDEQIKSEYAATEVTNLILVRAAMQELSLKEVLPLKINLTDGLLIQ